MESSGVTPDHDLDIAFTCLIAGSTDYHLGGFRAVLPENFGHNIPDRLSLHEVSYAGQM
jgi:hypothetical protein